MHGFSKVPKEHGLLNRSHGVRLSSRPYSHMGTHTTIRMQVVVPSLSSLNSTYGHAHWPFLCQLCTQEQYADMRQHWPDPLHIFTMPKWITAIACACCLRSSQFSLLHSLQAAAAIHFGIVKMCRGSGQHWRMSAYCSCVQSWQRNDQCAWFQLMLCAIERNLAGHYFLHPDGGMGIRSAWQSDTVRFVEQSMLLWHLWEYQCIDSLC